MTPLTRTGQRSAPGLLAALWLACALVFGAPGSGLAQEMAIPVQGQWPLFDNILAFDRSFDDRADGGIVVGVVYQSRFRPSVAVRSSLAEMAGGERLRLAGHDVTIIPIDLTSPAQLRRAIEDQEIDLLYLTPLRGVALPEIVQLADSLRVATITGVREYVQEGVALGLGQRGGRAEIVVNLESSRSQGLELRAQLLQIATVISRTAGESP